MTKYKFSNSKKTKPSDTTRHPENLKETWQKTKSVEAATAAAAYDIGGDPEYVNIFNRHYSDFSGKILEIGAGTGWFAKQILTNYPDVEYTILDIERNIENTVKHTLADFPEVRYITSANYTDALNETYDLFIETHCLSETPRYYYIDILGKLKTRNCLVIDYGGDPYDPGFNDTLQAWFTSRFTHKERTINKELLGGQKYDIPVYIGKSGKTE